MAQRFQHTKWSDCGEDHFESVNSRLPNTLTPPFITERGWQSVGYFIVFHMIRSLNHEDWTFKHRYTTSYPHFARAFLEFYVILDRVDRVDRVDMAFCIVFNLFYIIIN